MYTHTYESIMYILYIYTHTCTEFKYIERVHMNIQIYLHMLRVYI